MSLKKSFLFPLLFVLLFVYGCDYIVLPEEENVPDTSANKGWSALVTNVGTSETGDLRVELTIRNETANWSAMQAASDKPVVLTASDGKTTNCDTVFVSTGGHRLAPGFQMRGFITGTQTEPKTQLISVECKGVTTGTGAKLAIEYIYYTGDYNYYEKEANKANGKLELNLDQIVSDATHPIATPAENLIQPPSTEITALNNIVLKLTNVERTDKGLEFSWQTSNAGEYPGYVHIGKPPVIGSDGILYGRYESPDLESVPVTGAGKTAEWKTQVNVPQDVKNLYILLSVESKKQRYFVHYAIDISDK